MLIFAAGGMTSFFEKQQSFNAQLKQRYFADTNRDSFVRISVARNQLLRSVRMVNDASTMNLHVNQNTFMCIIDQAMKAMEHFKSEDWLKLFVIAFVGEEGLVHSA